MEVVQFKTTVFYHDHWYIGSSDQSPLLWSKPRSLENEGSKCLWDPKRHQNIIIYCLFHNFPKIQSQTPRQICHRHQGDSQQTATIILILAQRTNGLAVPPRMVRWFPVVHGQKRATGRSVSPRHRGLFGSSMVTLHNDRTTQKNTRASRTGNRERSLLTNPSLMDFMCFVHNPRPRLHREVLRFRATRVIYASWSAIFNLRGEKN